MTGVFQLAADGEAVDEVGCIEDPSSAGSGRPLEVPGKATLGITLSDLLLPPGTPEGVEPREGRHRLEIAGTSTLEALIADTPYEGRYSFYAGVDERRPFTGLRRARCDRRPRGGDRVLGRAGGLRPGDPGAAR